jgi:hypothetical protein
VSDLDGFTHRELIYKCFVKELGDAKVVHIYAVNNACESAQIEGFVD